MEPDVRDSVVYYVRHIIEKSEIKQKELLRMIGINKSKYFHWQNRLGNANKHNSNLPRSAWILDWEKEAIIKYAKSYYSRGDNYLKDGYRTLTYKMLDEDVAAVSPSSVYRILKAEGLLNRWNTEKKGTKGNGFKQPTGPHRHWHVDIKYVNYRGTFVFLISVMDGYSRYIVHHEVRATMQEYDVTLTVQRARDKYPDKNPKIISDNGGQFISKEFQKFIRNAVLKHVKTSVGYPQSNGKLERFHRSISSECLNTNSFITLEDTRRIIAGYIDHYNTKRLHSSLYYLTPEDMLMGREMEKIAIREEKFERAAIERNKYWSSNAA